MPVDRYLQIRHLCFDHYRAQPEQWDTAPSPFTQSVLARRYMDGLERKAPRDREDAPMDIEQALRYLSGVAVLGRSCEEAALSHLEPLFNSTCPPHIDPGTFEGLQLKVYSLAAYVHYRRFLASPEAIRDAQRLSNVEQVRPRDPLDDILRAADRANIAANMGFVSSAVVLAGSAFYCLVKQLGFNLGDLPCFQPLWGALEEYMRKLESVRLSVPLPHSAPGICAARHCGEKTLDDSGTRRVNCLRDDADSGFYCSVECQDEGWLQHQQGETVTIPHRPYCQVALPTSFNLQRLTDARQRLRDMIARGEFGQLR